MDVKGIKIGELRFQVTVTLCINQHDEKITLDVTPIGAHNLILGLPWLQTHNPTVNWDTGHIQFNSHYCSTYCFPCPHDVFAKQEPIALNTLEPDLVEIYAIDLMPTATEEALQTFVPPEYHDYLDVFDPVKGSHVSDPCLTRIYERFVNTCLVPVTCLVGWVMNP